MTPPSMPPSMEPMQPVTRPTIWGVTRSTGDKPLDRSSASLVRLQGGVAGRVGEMGWEGAGERR
jgi:hypothetical protein